MNHIQHSIHLDAPASDVFDALHTSDGLSAWWTRAVGRASPGETLDFHFGDHTTRMEVLRAQPSAEVAWRCTEGDPHWVGTEFRFELSEEQGKTHVRFSHRDWREAGDFFAHCTTKWGVFLVSLKQYVETGRGTPFPNEQKI